MKSTMSRADRRMARARREAEVEARILYERQERQRRIDEARERTEAMCRRARELRDEQRQGTDATRDGLRVHYAPFPCGQASDDAATTSDVFAVTCQICKTHTRS
jgi:hypothetical protein